MKILFLGAPNAGKGTYASKIKEIYNIPHISTGGLFRENIKNNTEVGQKAKSFIEAGELVPDEIVIEMLSQRISQSDCEDGFILDGFPRTIKQAEMLDEISRLDKVLNFETGKEVIIDRCSGRIICKDCGEIFHRIKMPPKQEGICDKCGGELFQREDDKPETLEKRLNVYHQQTAPLIDFYKNQNILETIKSDIDIRDPACTILEDCQKILNKILKNKDSN